MTNKKVVTSRIVNILAWVSFVVALIIVALSIIASNSAEQNAKEVLGVRAYIVSSDSMSKSEESMDEPIFFNSGDLVLVKRPENVLSIKEGDVITFISTNVDSYGLVITHKVKNVVFDEAGNLVGFETYGINTGVSDETLVAPENVTGVYFTKIPKIGSFFAFLKTPSGYFISILTPLILIIIFFSIKIGKIVERKEFYKEGIYQGEGEQEKPTIKTDKQEVLVTVKVVIENGNLAVVPASTPSQELVEMVKNEKIISEIGVSNTEDIITSEEQGEEMPQTIEEKLEAFSKAKVVKIPVAEKILNLDENVVSYFSNVHNELISYKKVHARTSLRCISYRVGRKLIAKVSVRGKTMLLHFALAVNEFEKNVYFQRDLSNLKAYADVPFTVKLKSARGEKRALTLVDALANSQGLIKKTTAPAEDVIYMLKEFKGKD